MSQDDYSWDSDDDLPLASFVQQRKTETPKAKRKKPNVTWSEETFICNFPEWTAEFGVNNNLSPLDLFMCFFDKKVIDMLVYYTNTYASQHNKNNTVTDDEFLCFVGVLILSGYVNVNRRRMYWENSVDAKNTLVCEAISRDRFQYIMTNLHCSDNTLLTANDKFSKMRPLFDALNDRFRLFAPEQEDHSVDEAMVPYFGRHGCKQFIKGKPIRWGYKVWAGTTRLGYIVWFDPYQGSSGILCDKYKDMGLGASVVLQYVDVLLKSGYRPYHIYFDNFFTSFWLLAVLTERHQGNWHH
nr:unnamed protein product [Callosobruchus chinensis]